MTWSDFVIFSVIGCLLVLVAVLAIVETINQYGRRRNRHRRNDPPSGGSPA